MKATFDLDANLYRAIKVEAARADLAVRAIVEDALRQWLERREDAEDAAAATEALAEYQRDGGVAAEAFLAERAAEVHAKYGSPKGR
jgi:hypothetical protein